LTNASEDNEIEKLKMIGKTDARKLLKELSDDLGQE
jgi:hypothetical protein